MRVIGRGLSLLFLGLAMLGLGCKDVSNAPSGLSYSANPATYVVGTAITPNNPTPSGGAIDSYSVAPALPAGLSLDPKSGVIAGTPTAATASASYTVRASNGSGSATASLSITVTSSNAITITVQPANQSILEGQTATFSVTAVGTGTLTYQWLKNAVAISGATSVSYITPAAVLVDNGSTFSVQVSDSAGGSLTSRTATLTVVAGGTGIFLQTGSMSAARDYHTATLLNTGQVLIVGGVNSGGTALDSAELYDPGTGAFSSTTGNLHGARQKHSATLLSDGKVLIAGGIVGAGGATTLATAEIYDPKTGTFTLTGSLARARSEHTATLVTPGLTTDQVLIVSGRDQGGYVPTAELYDPKAGTFTVTSNLPVAVRATHTATRLDNGKVLIAGGFHSGVLSAAELYDPANGTFTATGSLTTARAQQTATLLPGGKVLLVGGTTTLVAELFDPTSGTNGVFTATGSLKVGRIYGHTAALLPNGEVLIAGGLGTIGSPAPVLMEAEFFDLGTGTFTATGTMTAAREHHTATLLVASGKVLIVGGDAGTPFASAELYF